MVIETIQQQNKIKGVCSQKGEQTLTVEKQTLQHYKSSRIMSKAKEQIYVVFGDSLIMLNDLQTKLEQLNNAFQVNIIGISTNYGQATINYFFGEALP
jgi:hypothetical protein